MTQGKRYLYEERAAIFEHEAGLSKDDAEAQAWLEVHGKPCETVEEKALWLLETGEELTNE